MKKFKRSTLKSTAREDIAKDQFPNKALKSLLRGGTCHQNHTYNTTATSEHDLIDYGPR